MSVPSRLRITCYYCDQRAVVDFYEMGKLERAHNELRRHGWILGVTKEGGGVLFDPICHTCGRDVVKQMIHVGGTIDAKAEKHLRQIFPDLFEEKTDA